MLVVPVALTAILRISAFFPDGPTARLYLPGPPLPLAHKGEDVLVHFGLVRVAEKVHAVLQNHQVGFGGVGEELDFLARIRRAEDDIRGALAASQSIPPYPRHRIE